MEGANAVPTHQADLLRRRSSFGERPFTLISQIEKVLSF
jgi:hypothetical protein